MKLELKHLAPYLPYGLKYMKYSDHDSPIRHDIMQGISTNGVYACGDITPLSFKKCKPILRPLSDLTDPLINLIFKDTGENGIIISRYISDSLKDLTITITYKIMGDVFTDFVINRNDIRYTDYWIVEKLFENHFDVFGLIDKGLAIDKNTIKK